MHAKVTLRQIADAAGVAESTASRALKGQGQLSETTRSRIVDAAERLGYQTTAKRREEPAGVIGVVVAALHNSFYPYLVEALHHELQDRGFDMVLVIDELTPDRSSGKLTKLIDRLDGVIVTTATLNAPVVDMFVERGLPTVLAMRSNGGANVSVAESDNVSAGAEALTHLLGLGHRRIGFLMGPANTSTTQGRLDGARMTLEQAGLTLDPALLFHTDFTHDGGYSGAVQLLRRQDAPTAIFCANDVIAIGALDAVHKLGLQAPSDVSIIGVDDIPMASWGMIGLTTVRQPIGDIGAMAVKLISEAVHAPQQQAPQRHIFPTSLVVRRTTGPAPSAL